MKARKILSMIMALAMVISMMSVGVYAAGGQIYEVSDDATLATALTTAVDGDTIKLAAGTYTGGISVGKDITLEGTLGENGEKLTEIKGGNVAIYISKGTVKNLKITDAFRGFYGEPCGTVTFDNLHLSGVTYGMHLVAYSNDPVWTIKNCYIDASWANSFGTYECDGATIKIINNEFASTSPYYADSGSPLVNTFSSKTIISDNIFGENTKVLVREDAKDGTEIGNNYYEDGFENALHTSCANGVQIETYYTTPEMTETKVAPRGLLNSCRVNVDNPDRTFITTELGSVYAENSIKLEIYDNKGTLLATTNETDKVFNEITFPIDTLSVFTGINSTDDYWTTNWEDGKLRSDFVPAKAVLYVDGLKFSECDVVMKAATSNDDIVWSEVSGVPAVAKIDNTYYSSLEAALAVAGEDAEIDLLGNEVVLGATLNADKNITIKNGTIDATGVEFEQFGVFVDEGETITFEDVDFVLDNAKAYQGFFYNQGTVTFNGGSVVADGTDAPAIFHGGELETAGKFVINGTEITLSALVNGDEGGRGFLYPTLDIDDATITMTDLTDNAMRSVAGTVDNSTITVDGAEYGIKNKGFDGVLTVTNSEITISNTQNEDGANAGIYLESEEGLLADENSEINSSIYIPATEEGGEPTIYYILSFVNCELTHVQELNGTEIDLSEYVPTRDGYTFAGWYTDADCTEGNEIDSIVLDADITVYAAWTKNRTSGGNGGLQAGGDTSNKGADDLGQKDDAEDKTEEQTPVTPVTPAAHPFADVNSGDWYNAAVEYVYKNGLMNGTAEDKFSPNATLTRAMLVTVLYRAEGSPATNKSIPFGDVDMGAYYADAVIWAKQNGIVNGVTENDFAPNANINREQIAAIMHRYASYKGYNVAVAAELTGFADAKNVSAYAVDAMKYAVGAGIINGKTATTVNPAEFATRAELATILMRFIENNK